MAELMKGNTWRERKDAKDRKGNPIVTYPVYVEDKHDEIRCHVIVTWDPFVMVQYLSYAGKPLANMSRFDEVFKTLSRGTGWKEFDLGFEVNENFNDSYRWVRSTKKLPDDLKDAKFRFLVFGLPDAGGTLDQQRLYRYQVRDYATDWVSVPFVVPFCVRADSEVWVDRAFDYARSRGLEGVMVKQPMALYERKRTDGWLKLKNEDTYDGCIVGFEEATCGKDQPELGLKVGDALHRIGSILVQCADGSTASPHGIPHELGARMYNSPSKYIGQWVEFAAMERDRRGGYRHPVFRRFRESKAELHREFATQGDKQ